MELLGNRDFMLNKILAGGMTSLILFLVSRLESLQSQWVLLILLIVVLGQGHFVSTYIYLSKSLPKKLGSRKNWIVYASFLTVATYIFGLLRWEYRLDAFILGFVGLYFLFHHILNEQTIATFYSDPHPKHYPETFFLFLLVTLVFLPTLNSESFSFLLVQEVVLVDQLSNLTTYHTQTIIPDQVVYMYGVCILLITLWHGWTNPKNDNIKIMTMAGLTGCALFLVYLKWFEDFLYFLAFIILFHYLTWFLFFLFRLKRASHGEHHQRNYAAAHLLIYLSLLALFVIGQFSPPKILWNAYYVMFSVNFFLFWTFLHITVTLINEKPIEHLIKRL